jgi:alkanesulfonate monooxygenase SsuD/methylene tetrahydromethanopterin reductase-like flavin-dependent oxidoreductase (luciferase family)
MRACWTQERVNHSGRFFHYEDLRVEPKPRQSPPDVWLGGIAPSELKRVGRLADGWLPSFVTPADVEKARTVIEEVARQHDREIEDEHYGALIPYANGDVPTAVLENLRTRRPDLADINELIPSNWEQLGALVRRFVDVGTSKFVILPLNEPGSAEAWVSHLEEAATTVIPWQT